MSEQVEGQNLPRFQALQLDFAAHIRNPDENPIPVGIEDRRMAIYVRLFYNNIESFCATRFQRAKRILGDEVWHGIIRDFVHRHQSKSPYFSQISEEFIAYLAMERTEPTDPPFLLELCHYDWLPLFLDRLPGELPPYQPCEDPLAATLQTSELVQVRRYEWPVHKISVKVQPENPPGQPTWALAFRNRADKVDVKHPDAFTANLVEKLKSPMVGREAVQEILGKDAQVTPDRWDQIARRIDDLIELDVLLVANP